MREKKNSQIHFIFFTPWRKQASIDLRSVNWEWMHFTIQDFCVFMQVSLNVSRPFLLTINMMKTQSWMWIWGSKLQTEWEQLTGLPLDIRVLFLKLLFPFVQLLLEILKFLLVLVLLLFGNLFFWERLYRKTKHTFKHNHAHRHTYAYSNYNEQEEWSKR